MPEGMESIRLWGARSAVDVGRTAYEVSGGDQGMRWEETVAWHAANGVLVVLPQLMVMGRLADSRAWGRPEFDDLTVRWDAPDVLWISLAVGQPEEVLACLPVEMPLMGWRRMRRTEGRLWPWSSVEQAVRCMGAGVFV